MYKKSSGVWEVLAVMLSVLTVFSALVIIFVFGITEKEAIGHFGVSRGVERSFDWPLIVFCTVSAFYSMLFSVVVCSLKRTESMVIDMATHFGLGSIEGNKKEVVVIEEITENTRDMPA